MEILAGDLTEILKILESGIATKELIAQSSHFIFTSDHISSFNDRICVSYPFQSDFKCSIKANEFQGILSKLDMNTKLTITQEDGQLVIISDNIRAGFAAVKEGQIFDVISSFLNTQVEFQSLPTNFIQGLSLCRFSVAKDAMFGALAGVYVNNNRVISGDDFRVGRYILNSSFNEPMLLPAEAVSELIKIPVTKYYLTSGWAHFLTDKNIQFSTRLLSLDFPEVDSFFEVSNPKAIITFPKDTKKIMESLIGLTEGDTDLDRRIEINISPDGNTTFRAEKKGICWAERDLKLDYIGDEVTFTANPIFFSQILDTSTTMSLFEAVAIFTAENFSHLVALSL